MKFKRIFILVVILFLLAKMLDYSFPLNLPFEQKRIFAQVVVDENNRPLRTFADEKGIWRFPITLNQVSPLYIEALLNYEDRYFWYHPGINPISIIRAAILNISNGRIVSGGSTISMQVARILHPHQRSFLGKTKQILRTLQLEWHLNKADILQLYLNTAPFGGAIEGVQAASFTYLNKSAQELSHAEAALLAVLPQAPTRYRPDLHNKAAEKARNKVLQRLGQFNVWPKSIIEDALLEQVYSFSYRAKQLAPLLSRRLIIADRKKAERIKTDKNIVKNNKQENKFQAINSRVIKTTINSDLQENLQDLAGAYIKNMPQKSSAAILVVENSTAEVKAYVGSADFANPKRYGYVDMVQAIRSPGSTLKPFLYGMALDEGLIHTQSLLADVPRSWGEYRPENFSGVFHGAVSAEEALQRSLNMPAVDLLERYGASRFVSQLENAGLVLSIPQNKASLAVILGGAGVSLEQLVQTYMSLANEGKTSKLRYLKDENKYDNQQKQNERPLLSKESAWLIQDVLSDIKRPNSVHTLSATTSSYSSDGKEKLAWKTGTSYGYRDAWAIGVSKKYTIGVWLGRPDGTAMPGHFGRITAGPLLFSIADQLNIKANKLPLPENIEKQTICWPTGELEDELITQGHQDFCQQKKQAWIMNSVVPPTWHIEDSNVWQSSLINYWQDSESHFRVSMDCMLTINNIGSPSPVKKQIAVWPKILSPWLNPKYRRENQLPPVDPRCIHSAISQSAQLKIMGIIDKSVYRKSGQKGASPTITLKTLGGIGSKYWYINGKYRYKTEGNSKQKHVLNRKGVQQIIVQDQQGNSDMVTITLL